METRSGALRLALALAVTCVLTCAAGSPSAQSEPIHPKNQPVVEDQGTLGPTAVPSCTSSLQVRQIYLGLKDSFKDFTEDEKCRIAEIAAREKAGQPTEAIVEFARTRIGGLKVSSAPAGASIWVNGIKLEGTTSMRVVTTIGDKSMRLVLPGHEEGTGVVAVEAGKWTLFHRDLVRT